MSEGGLVLVNDARACLPARQAGRSDAGMTLIELIVAASIISIAIMTLLTVIPTSDRLSVIAAEEDVARNAIQREIAEIRAFARDAHNDLEAVKTTYNAQSFAVEGLFWDSNGSKTRDEGDSLPGYVTVADWDGAEAGETVLLVTVQVVWHSASGTGQHQLQMRSLIAY